jgi:hypothetical protein
MRVSPAALTAIALMTSLSLPARSAPAQTKQTLAAVLESAGFQVTEPLTSIPTPAKFAATRPVIVERMWVKSKKVFRKEYYPRYEILIATYNSPAAAANQPNCLRDNIKDGKEYATWFLCLGERERHLVIDVGTNAALFVGLTVHHKVLKQSIKWAKSL